MAETNTRDVISHWHKLIDKLKASSMDFYKSLESAIEERSIPGVLTSRVHWQEGGILTGKRVYFRVTRQRYVFDICAAPFGRGFFVSWWLAYEISPYGLIYGTAIVLGLIAYVAALAQFLGVLGVVLGFVTAPFALFLLGRFTRTMWHGLEDAILAFPLLGWVYDRYFKPTTYYTTDTRLMFESAVRLAVHEVIDEITAAQGLRALSDDERRPLHEEFYRG